jgi:hypothetical protein
VTTKKPLKPEKLVERQVLAMCARMGLDVDVIESKATYSKNLERYTKSKAAPVGMADLVGNDANGVAVFIELKAPGKVENLRPEQRAFLLRKIQSGCFAVAVDDPELLFSLYVRWRKEGSAVLLERLGSCVPKVSL